MRPNSVLSCRNKSNKPIFNDISMKFPYLVTYTGTPCIVGHFCIKSKKLQFKMLAVTKVEFAEIETEEEFINREAEEREMAVN